MNISHFKHSVECDGLSVQYDLCYPGTFKEYASEVLAIDEASSYEQKVAAFEAAYSETLEEIDRLTNNADGLDYSLAVSAGLISGLLDIFIVGEWDFEKAKGISNREINDKILRFAKKNGLEKDAHIDEAIEFLEKKFPFPGDNTWSGAKINVSTKTHHLDDFKHHPTPIGLICSILDQFREVSTYHDRFGEKYVLPMVVTENGLLEGKTPAAKVSAGIINWCVSVAKNRKGHLMSDMGGSKNTAGAGMGLPGGILSTLRELASLPGFRDSDFALKLTNAYRNGIGTGKGQVDLGAFNSLFEGAKETSSRFDMRTERAIKHELRRQTMPIVVNEIVVRTFYCVRHFVTELRKTGDVAKIEWNLVLPFKNRTIARMVTISTGTMEVVDMAGAAAVAAVKSGGAGPIFVEEFILHVNFVGVGRFAIAVSTDLMMGVRKERMELAMASAEVAKAAQVLTSSTQESETRIEQTRDFIIQSTTGIQTHTTPDRREKMGYSIDAIQVNPDVLTLKDIRDAAEQIFVQKADEFETIKSQKWYHDLKRAITFHSGDRKKIISDIQSLSKVQQLLILAYTQNFNGLDDNLKLAIQNLCKRDNELSAQIKGLENILFGFQTAQNVTSLPDHDKRTLSACIRYLAKEYGTTSQLQQEYASALRELLKTDAETDDLDMAISRVETRASQKCLLVCCLEYIYLYQESEDLFHSDICERMTYKLGVGEITVSEAKEKVLADINVYGVQGLINKYAISDVEIDEDFFTHDIEWADLEDVDVSAHPDMELTEPMPLADVPSCKEPCTVFPFEEIGVCIKKYVNDEEKPLGTLQYQSGEALSEKTDKLVKKLFPNAAPALKTVVAITKSKKSYLVFTTFALYYICGKEFLQIRYGEISPGTLGTTVEGDEPVFFCGTKKIPGSEVNIDALKNFCSEVSQITFKPDTDQLQPLSDLPFEVQIDYYSILSGVVGRTEGLHEVYRLVCDRKLEEYWNLFSEEQDTPIVQRIKDWKHTIPYPNEESTCEHLLADICWVLYVTKDYAGHISDVGDTSAQNIVESETELFPYIVDNGNKREQIKNDAKQRVDAFTAKIMPKKDDSLLGKITPENTSQISQRMTELNATLRSYAQAANASKSAGLQSINQRLVLVDKKLRNKTGVPILSTAYANQVELLIRKFLKEAKSLGKYTERFLTADREKMLKQMAPKGKVIQAEDTIGLYDPSIVNTIISTYSGILFAKDGFYYKDRLRVTWVPYAEIEAVKKGIGSLKITTRKEGAKRQTSIDLNGILFATSELEKLFSDIRVLYQG